MNKATKIIKASFDALMTVILILGILFLILFVVGIRPYVVISGSMEPAVHKGSLSFINKHSKYEDIKNGDIIAYQTPTGDKVTHRVREVTEEGFITRGDANSVDDVALTTESNFLGKNIFSIPMLGYVVGTLQTTRGKIVLGTIIVLILVASFLLDDKSVGKREKK